MTNPLLRYLFHSEFFAQEVMAAALFVVACVACAIGAIVKWVRRNV